MKYCYKKGNKIIHSNKKPKLKIKGKVTSLKIKVKPNKYMRHIINYVTK